MSLPMFDPPDYPYKDLHESLIYDSDRLMFSVGAINDTVPLCTNNTIAEVTEEMISDIENTLSFSNDNGRYFNNIKVLDNIAEHEQSTELYIVQSENQLNYEPTLLDENTVNQFLLPLKVTKDGDKDTEDKGSDLLSLHSCVMCHEVFMTDVALLDHTIAMHTSASGAEMLPNVASVNQQELNVTGETSVANDNYESEWLVCSICGRVLSTALEIKPSEQLCCDNGHGNCSISTRKLDTMFVCDLCSGLFADGVALDRHRQTCNLPVQQDQYTDQSINNSPDKNPSQIPEVCYSCDICEKQFASAEQLKLHVVECQRPVTRRVRRPYTSAPNNKMWNCGSCNQLFATARELYRHKRGEDRPPGAPLMAYVCEECDKVLGSMCALHTHKKMHKVSKPGYPCRICGRLFNQSGHLAIHMRMHTGERPYPCDLCPKAFKVKVERDDHRRTHTGERPFACTNCPKTFTAAARLREHARIHTDQRPYQCDICGAAFRRPYARTVHTLIHTGEKPHECDICGTAFRRSGDMWKHKRTIHSVQSVTENVE